MNEISGDLQTGTYHRKFEQNNELCLLSDTDASKQESIPALANVMSAMTLSADLSANFPWSVSKLTLPNSSNSLPVNKHTLLAWFISFYFYKEIVPSALFTLWRSEERWYRPYLQSIPAGDKLLAPSKKSKMPTKPNSNASKNESSPKRGRNQDCYNLFTH